MRRLMLTGARLCATGMLATALAPNPAALAQPRPASTTSGPGATAPDPAALMLGPSSAYRPPAGIGFRPVDIMSDGVRLHGELFWPESAQGRKLPTVVSAHGWGGTAAALRRDAVELARAGYLVLDFDYKGWGESDSRVILVGKEPASTENNRFTAEVQAQRGYIDPFEQVEDWFSALDWIQAEPMADVSRIGIRGSSYSGGHVVYVAANDPRVKALVSQVAGIADRPDPARAQAAAASPYLAAAHDAGTKLARGETRYPDPKVKAVGNLIGAPVGDKLLRWHPNAEAVFVSQPALFIIAQNEELVDNATNGRRAYERVTGPKKLVEVPGIKHYGIYGPAREQAITLAIDWFNQHLKP